MRLLTHSLLSWFFTRNDIKTLDAVGCLRSCRRLVDMSLIRNPVLLADNYRDQIQSYIPSLLILDDFGTECTGMDGKISASECSSSCVSSTSNDIDNSILSEDGAAVRSSESETSQQIRLKMGNSASHDCGNNVSINSGDPIVGNFVCKARQRRKRNDAKRSRSASSMSTQSLESFGDPLSTAATHDSFHVESTIAMIAEPRSDAIDASADGNGRISNTKLLRMLRTWREKSSKTRGTKSPIGQNA